MDIALNEFILEVQSNNSFTYMNNGSLANKLKLEYTVIEEDSNETFAGTPLFFRKDSLKLKVFISDWTSHPSSHYLQVIYLFIYFIVFTKMNDTHNDIHTNRLFWKHLQWSINRVIPLFQVQVIQQEQSVWFMNCFHRMWLLLFLITLMMILPMIWYNLIIHLIPIKCHSSFHHSLEHWSLILVFFYYYYND